MQPSDLPEDPQARLIAEPPEHLVKIAVEVAGWSPCRSKRGVVLFAGSNVIAQGFNRKPDGFECDGSAECKSTCRTEAVHAEQAALLNAGQDARGREMLHVKAVDGRLVPSGGPSCVQCSKLAVEARVAGMWLYHDTGWRRYPIAEFHRLSLQSCSASPSKERRFTCGCTYVTDTEGLRGPSHCPEHGGETLGLCPYCHKPVEGYESSEATVAHTQCVPVTCPPMSLTPEREALRQLVEKWKAEGAAKDTFHATMGIGWKACAKDLEALLLRRSPPLPIPAWKCKACGCLWRDNLDGTVSLFDAHQKSCAACEGSTPAACEIYWLSMELATQLSAVLSNGAERDERQTEQEKR